VAHVDDEVLARFATDAGLFSADRFHPSPAGYALFATTIDPHLRAAAATRAA